MVWVDRLYLAAGVGHLTFDADVVDETNLLLKFSTVTDCDQLKVDCAKAELNKQSVQITTYARALDKVILSKVATVVDCTDNLAPRMY